MAGLVLSPQSVSVAAGGVASCIVTVRNTSTVVESYAISVLGDAAAWATAEPATLSLFPGADGTTTINFRPPRASDVRAGAVDFAVRVVGSQQPDDSAVEEGSITIEPFVDLNARMSPRTSETKRSARHVVSVENRGNAPVTVVITALDPDDVLAFEPTPPSLTIAPGETEASSIRVAARSGHARGPALHRQFQAMVTPTAGGATPITLDGALVQKAALPRFVPALIGAAIVLVAAAVLIPPLLKDDGGGTFALSSANAGATTTVPVVGGEAAGEEGANAEAEAEAEAGGEAGGDTGGAGGTDTGATDGDSGGGSTGASSGATGSAGGTAAGSGSTTGGTTGSAGGGSTATTATSTPSGAGAATSGGGSTNSSTSTSSSTTSSTSTTAPSFAGADKFAGTWLAADGSGTCIQISRSSSSMRADVFAPRSLTPTTGTGSATDANDGSFKVTFKSSGVVQTYSLNSTSTILTVATDGSFSRGSTFNRIKGTCT